ncbi:MAG: MinD/ParA family protein [Proteobacteria bacterium]|nr:MinD/ParA family protein [Pseudomonadota bacterium]
MARMKTPVTLCVTSGKGGVGKTSIAVNLAFALVQKGQRVLVVDGDLGLANVDVLLRLSVQRTICDVLDSGADPLESVIYLEESLGILPASSGVPEMVTLGPEEQAQLGEVLTSIMSHFDYVLVDTAAGIGPSVLWFNRFVDHNIILLSPDPTSFTDAYALIKILSRDYDRDYFYVVFNLVSSEREGRQSYKILEGVVNKFLDVDIEYLGAIPQDKVIHKAVREQLPFVQQAPQSNAARAVFDLADRIRMLKEKQD